MKTVHNSSTAAAAAGLRSGGSEQAAEPLSSPLSTLAATCKSSEGELGSVGLGTSVDVDDDDEDGTGVHVGRVATAVEVEQTVASTAVRATAPHDSGTCREAAAVESRGGEGRVRATPVIGAAGRTGAARIGGGTGGDNGGGADNNAKKSGSGRRGVAPRHKKVCRLGLCWTVHTRVGIRTCFSQRFG